MNRIEREHKAVSNHACPRCHAASGVVCRSVGAVRKVMKVPHPERVKMVREG